ncbi:hypothetical protein [Leptospira santarosai]|nr:hypothetical protein [Leptospira santarosai]
MFFVGDPFTPERVIEELQTHPDREQGSYDLEEVETGSFLRRRL